MQAGRDKARDMRHVDHEVSADGIGDLTEALEIDRAAVSGCAGDDQLRSAFFRDALAGVIVDEAVLVDTVGNRMEIAAGDIGRRTVGQVTALVKAHTHEGVARLKERIEDRKVGLRAGVRLNVRIGAAKEFHRTVSGKVFDHVDIFAAAVVAVTGVAFGVLVGQN